METTLEKIRRHGPCRRGWVKLLNGLGKAGADDEPLLIREVLDINGFADTLWAMRAVDGYGRERRLFSLWCVRRVECALLEADVTEDFLDGGVNPEEIIRMTGMSRNLWLEKLVLLGDVDRVSRETASALAYYMGRKAEGKTTPIGDIGDCCTHRRLFFGVYHDAFKDEHVEQEKEFRRMLQCIESGETYKI